MPIKYIGRQTYEEGKTLWEILCRLKNFGVGRMVYRNRFNQVYPEPSYYVITRVRPDMSNPEHARGSTAWGFKVWRGGALGEMPIQVGFKPDWKLVPRKQESSFRDTAHAPLEPVVVKDTVDLPPLIQYMMKLKDPNAKPPLLKLEIRQKPHNRAMLSSELDSLQS